MDGLDMSLGINLGYEVIGGHMRSVFQEQGQRGHIPIFIECRQTIHDKQYMINKKDASLFKKYMKM